jgi:hypothetical protein
MSKLNIQYDVIDKINLMTYKLYYYYGDNFSDDALVLISPKRISTPVEETYLLQYLWKEPQDEEYVHHNEHTTADVMDLLNLYDLLDGCAKSFCKSYHKTCDKCMVVGHFSFQCSIILEQSLVSNTRDEVIKYLVYKGVHDLLLKIHCE